MSYVRVRDKAINDRGESASHRQSVTGVTSNGGGNPRRHYHDGGVLSLALHHSQTPHHRLLFINLFEATEKQKRERKRETLKDWEEREHESFGLGLERRVRDGERVERVTVSAISPHSTQQTLCEMFSVWIQYFSTLIMQFLFYLQNLVYLYKN